MWFAIAIGLFEELLFRGYALLQPDIHPRFAIFMSSVAFTLVHWLGGHSSLALVPIFSFGIAFGIVRIVSGRRRSVRATLNDREAQSAR